MFEKLIKTLVINGTHRLTSHFSQTKLESPENYPRQVKVFRNAHIFTRKQEKMQLICIKWSNGLERSNLDTQYKNQVIWS